MRCLCSVALIDGSRVRLRFGGQDLALNLALLRVPCLSGASLGGWKEALGLRLSGQDLTLNLALLRVPCVSGASRGGWKEALGWSCVVRIWL